MAEGPRDALVSRNSGTIYKTSYLKTKSPGPIVWHYLRDPTFSRFHAIPECDRHTHTHTHTHPHKHTTTAYTALSIALRGKNNPRLDGVNSRLDLASDSGQDIAIFPLSICLGDYFAYRQD